MTNINSYEKACRQAIEALSILSEYTEDGQKELTASQIKWLATVQMSFYKAMGASNDDDDDDGSDFRVDGELY